MSDIAMCIGQEHYPWPSDFSDEAKSLGVSKQIPRTAIPSIDPGKSCLVLIHPHVLISVNTPGMTLIDLGIELEGDLCRKVYTLDGARAWVMENLIDAETGHSKLCFIDLLKQAELESKLKRYEEKYNIKYHYKFIGYTYLTGIQYVAKDSESQLPPKLEGKGIEAVRIKYREEQ